MVMKNEKTKQWLQLTFAFFFLLVLVYGVTAMSWFVFKNYGNSLDIMTLLVLLLVVAAFVASIFEE
jgi:succinate dehydrogenase hydrophobic anchor subunit